MKKTILSGCLLASCCLASVAQEDKTTIISKNLVKNSDFTKGKDLPDNWSISTMAPEVFNIKWYHPENGENYFSMESLGPDYSGYINQKIKVKKDAWYRIKIRLSHTMGRGLIWLYGYDENNKPVLFDRRKYLSSFVGNPLVPRFIRKELMNGSEDDSWRDVIFEFQNKGNKNQVAPSILRLSVGIYFSNAKLRFKSIKMWEIKKPGNKIK
ncbi:MAG: hypothetical protein L3J71_02820 [Victivallaceae bacterium]|nr:hypothetical protein [Victivallaceae bacterium]